MDATQAAQLANVNAFVNALKVIELTDTDRAVFGWPAGTNSTLEQLSRIAATHSVQSSKGAAAILTALDAMDDAILTAIAAQAGTTPEELRAAFADVLAKGLNLTVGLDPNQPTVTVEPPSGS